MLEMKLSPFESEETVDVLICWIAEGRTEIIRAACASATAVAASSTPACSPQLIEINDTGISVKLIRPTAYCRGFGQAISIRNAAICEQSGKGNGHSIARVVAWMAAAKSARPTRGQQTSRA